MISQTQSYIHFVHCDSLSFNWNAQTPFTPTLLVLVILMILAVPDPGTFSNHSPSPASYPTCAAFPPSPFIPPEASPVVHSMSPSA